MQSIYFIHQQDQEIYRLIKTLTKNLNTKFLSPYPRMTLSPKNRLCRNQHSLAFHIPSASTNAYLHSFFLQTHRENMSIQYIPPYTPLLYSKTGVCRGIPIFLKFLIQNIDSGYSLEPPRRGCFNVYPQSMF